MHILIPNVRGEKRRRGQPHSLETVLAIANTLIEKVPPGTPYYRKRAVLGTRVGRAIRLMTSNGKPIDLGYLARDLRKVPGLSCEMGILVNANQVGHERAGPKGKQPLAA